MYKSGDRIIQHNDNGTIFVGYVLATFQDLEGFPRYVAQRPADGLIFIGHIKPRKELPPLVSSR